MMEDIKIIADPPSEKNSVVLMGFPGSGLVGSITLQYLIDKMDFVQIGTMTSKYLPPVAMMAGGLINPPIRIYEKGGYMAVISDVPIHPAICYEISNALMDWLSRFEPGKVVVVAGIITNETEKRVFGVATNEETLSEINNATEILTMGSISGAGGSILTECTIRGIPAIGLLGETVNAPDPRAAVAVIETMNKLFNLGISTKELEEQAIEIEAQMQKLAEQIREHEEVPKKEQLPMYG